jgi:hypothetical protein
MQLTIPEENPLLRPPPDPVADCCSVEPATIKRRIPAKRLIQDARRLESAAVAVAHLDRDGTELVGLTRGQFSLSDLIAAILDRTGPAALGISTWTAAHADVSRMMDLLETGRIVKCRWLVDLTFVRRCPALAQQIRQQFGADAIRVTRTHAKFGTITNAEWQIALRSSMNLNQNPRLESFEVGHDPALCEFLNNALDQIWQRQPRHIADPETPLRAVTRWWDCDG